MYIYISTSEVLKMVLLYGFWFFLETVFSVYSDAQFFFFGQVKSVLDDMLEKLPEEYNLAELMSKTAERSPYILVCLQECERMNLLLAEIHRSLTELDQGLKVGDQTRQNNQYS